MKWLIIIIIYYQELNDEKPTKGANKSRSRGKEKSPELIDALKRLDTFYAKYNEKIFEQIGRTIDWSTKTGF